MLKNKLARFICFPTILVLAVFIDESNAADAWPKVSVVGNPFPSFAVPRNNFANWIPPVVTQFKSQVFNEVQRSPKLTSVLRSLNQAPSLLWSDSMFYVFTAFAGAQGIEDPGSIGTLITKNVQKTGYLSGDVILAAEVAAAGKYLLNSGLMNFKNSAGFAHAYVNHLWDIIKQTNGGDYTASNAAAISLGLIAFISKETPGGVEDIKQIVELLSNELLMQGDTQKGMATTNKKSSYEEGKFALPKPFLKIRDDACRQNAEPVRLFHQSLLNSIRSSPELSDLFNLGSVLTSLEYRKHVFFTSHYNFHATNVSDGALLADFASRFILDIPFLSLEAVVSAFGRGIGRFFLSQGVLYNHNVTPKIKHYLHNLKESARTIANSKNPRTNAIAMSLASYKFIDRYLNFDSIKAKELVEICGNEWRCSASI